MAIARATRMLRNPFCMAALALVLIQVVLVTARQAEAQGDFVFASETDSGTTDVPVVVSLSTPMEKTARVDYATADGTAIAHEDYEPTSGTVVFRPGETRQVIEIEVFGDRRPEGDETFFLTTEGSRTTITIVDDDPSISIFNQTIMEGDDGVHDLIFSVSLAVPQTPDDPDDPVPPTPPGGRFPERVAVSYETFDATALGGQDYVPTSGRLVFDAGATNAIIRVPIKTDLIPERDEVFNVVLSDPSRGEIINAIGQGTILNDDATAFTGEPAPDFAEPGGPVPPGARPAVSGVRSVTSAGEILTFGDLPTFGSAAALKLNQPVVGMAATPSRNGYWMVASDGGVFTFGDAKFLGSTGDLTLQQPIVGIAGTPTGNGYWLVAADGGIFAFGDATFAGSAADIDIAHPIVGMAATPTGQGYWILTSQGGLFHFGDAGFLGSMGGRRLNKPMVAMAATPSGNGYWMVASDGGIFSFGDAKFFGSTVGINLNAPIISISSTPSGNGYWLMASDGGLFAFGDAPFLPRRRELSPGVPVVGMAPGPALQP